MMKNFRTRALMASLVVAFVVTRTGWAVVSFESVTWGSGGDTLNWNYDASAADSLTSPSTGGSGDDAGYLKLYFSEPPMMPVNESDRMWTTESTLVGDFVTDGVGSLSFDFLGYADTAQALFFESTGASWGYSFSSTASSTWETKNFSFASASGWNLLSGSGSFADALASVSTIGVMMTHSDAVGDFTYGVDNWDYGVTGGMAVPEPGSIAMSVTALLGMGGLLRRRRRPSVEDGDSTSVADTA
jgi:hypothetical protein